MEQLVVHYACDGWLLHASSNDAQRQLAANKACTEAAARSEHEVCDRRCQDGRTVSRAWLQLDQWLMVTSEWPAFAAQKLQCGWTC